MRNRLLSGSPSVRLALVSLLVLLVSLAASGCGGGGGGGGGNPGGGGGGGGNTNPNTAIVKGTVVDNNGAAVVGAKLTIVNAPAGTVGVSGADGTYTIPNVPLTSTQFVVTPPPGYQSVSYKYNGTTYAGQDSYNVQCGLPLPTLANQQTFNVGNLVINSPGSPPPPPPTGGCTK